MSARPNGPRGRQGAVGLLALGLAVAGGRAAAAQQLTVSHRVSARVIGIGRVEAVSPLRIQGEGEGASLVGTVTLLNNGPYQLEVRLLGSDDSGVWARSPGGQWQPLEQDWMVVGEGPGGFDQRTPVEYRIAGAGGLEPPPVLEYRVVPAPPVLLAGS